VLASPQTLHWCPDTSLVRRLHRRGFDVYLLEHRGDRNALAGRGAGPCDLDAIVAHDLPAALARVRRYSGHPRALWIGHGLGGQLLYAFLARGGSHDLAAGVTLGAPVRFGPVASRARLLARAARLLPSGLRLPARRLAQLAATAESGRLAAVGLGRDLDGPRARGLMVHGAADLPAAMLRQAARWLESGTLCDRDDRFDYVAALAGLRFPLLGVAAHGDPMGPPADTWPALDALDGDGVERIELDDSWGHLDLLVGRRAETDVMPAVVDYVVSHRRGCREPRGPAGR
jgi:predicted alpha/beta hydrolase